MKKIFIKNYKTKNHIQCYSGKYFFALFTEIFAIILWSIGLFEIYKMNLTNPFILLIHIGALLFTCGSMIFAKFIKIN